MFPVSDNQQNESVTTPSTVSTEDKVKMLHDWIGLIQLDVDAIQAVRNSEYDVYAKQKRMYDSWLAKRWKTVVRYDKKIKERKDQIAEIEGEIKAILERPEPGILPPLPEDTTVRPKRTKWRKPGTPRGPVTFNATEAVPVGTPTTYTPPDQPAPPVDINSIELSPEERSQLNAEAHGSSS